MISYLVVLPGHWNYVKFTSELTCGRVRFANSQQLVAARRYETKAEAMAEMAIAEPANRIVIRETELGEDRWHYQRL